MVWSAVVTHQAVMICACVSVCVDERVCLHALRFKHVQCCFHSFDELEHNWPSAWCTIIITIERASACVCRFKRTRGTRGKHRSK